MCSTHRSAHMCVHTIHTLRTCVHNTQIAYMCTLFRGLRHSLPLVPHPLRWGGGATLKVVDGAMNETPALPSPNTPRNLIPLRPCIAFPRHAILLNTPHTPLHPILQQAVHPSSLHSTNTPYFPHPYTLPLTCRTSLTPTLSPQHSPHSCLPRHR